MPNTKIAIIGHSDLNDSESTNSGIAQERAESVYDFLTSIFKMDSKRIEVYSEGENKFEIPKDLKVNAKNKNEINRSVTIILK